MQPTSNELNVIDVIVRSQSDQINRISEIISLSFGCCTRMTCTLSCSTRPDLQLNLAKIPSYPITFNGRSSPHISHVDNLLCLRSAYVLSSSEYQ